MSVIVVRCTDQVLKIVEAPVVASGGKNEVKVEFDFCEKWDGYAKTAIFYRDINDPYYAILSSEDVCVVPWEVCYKDGTFYFSVFGDKGDIRRTSTTVKYKVKKGVIFEDMKPSDPTPDVYSQIMAVVGRIEEGQKDYVDAAFAPKLEAINEIEAQIRSLADHVEDLHYKPIDITSCSVSPSVVEVGAEINEATVSWAVNKAPVSQTVEGWEMDVAQRKYTFYALAATRDRDFVVKVVDERGATDEATAWIRFYQGVYYGALDVNAVINSAAIRKLTKSLQSGKAKTYTATAGAGQKFAYALPSRYGTPAFNVGGFDYVWTKAATFDFTNASGYTEPYDVWLNDEVVVGTRTIKVT